ncbi:hypothetical protein KP509_06G077700 [Ceratopteris richardii]|uniref:non-specific serine/threonine protein kinase n=2 Tax=Ceratopteris richardii TaxID=49495 RepID=A0A8T2ULY1_CERRI|nr:hypothetical protein KP509_06G077700 [Ceratopteris richardii]
MLNNRNRHQSARIKMQRWENQNQFIQDRHGHAQGGFQEVIIVGLWSEKDSFELLSWAISVASRTGDSVIAFHLIGPESSNRKSRNGLQAADSQIEALKELCELKQVNLFTKFARPGHEELQLIREASSLHATMLVLSPFTCYDFWDIHKTGGLFVQRVHLGCSVVIVKDYKVVFYEENSVNKDKASNSASSAASDQPPLLRSKSLHQQRVSLTRYSSRSSPSRHNQGEDDLGIKIVTGSKIWPDQAGERSPKSIIDAVNLSSEWNTSMNSSSGSTSIPRRGILSCASLQDDAHSNDETTFLNTNHILSKLRRNASLSTSLSFPPASGCLKKFPVPVSCTSMKGSFKAYVNSLQSTKSMSHDPFAPVLGSQLNWRCFPFEEIAKATDNFNPVRMVGKGGHSEVFKGTLADGELVAVKRLRNDSTEDRSEKEFLTELGIIGHVSHTNTISLVGFCVEEGLHLIFNFSPYGSLASLLHGTSLLDWSSRFKIAIGIARGLHYLHAGCPRRIIHRDIKASNILLGTEFEPQISDFGLAKWFPEQWSQMIVSPVEGTFGYLAPEYFMHGIVSEKTDVFAYGVLLLELITGKQPINEYQESLVIWARPLLESMKMAELVDPRLSGEYETGEMQTIMKAAALCVHSSSARRPYMAQVLEILTGERCPSPCKRQSQHHDHHYTNHPHADFSDEYSSSSTYMNDLSRHREIALEF